jgi:hypothetical protein
LAFPSASGSEGDSSFRPAVAPAKRSPAAKEKDFSKHTADGLPVPCLRSLLADLAAPTKNFVRLRGSEGTFYQLTEATVLQRRILALLDLTA